MGGMDKDIRTLVQALHDGPTRIVVTTAGAGTWALAWLLGVAGASRTLIEALVPYDAAAFDDFLGQTPPQYVAARTAKLMAGRAYTRGRWLRPDAEQVIGLTCTATIVTDRPKRGEHRAHIATWQPERVIRTTLHLEKGARDREGEEALVSRVILNALAEAAGLGERVATDITERDSLKCVVVDLSHKARLLHDGEIERYGVADDGRFIPPEVNPRALLSGAFNPLHEGHLDLARAAAAHLGQPVAFELAAVNVDKPPLENGAILKRMAQFAGRWPIYASRAPTYVEKARLYPGVVFVVGYDTAVRVLNPRYYDDDADRLAAALAEIRRHGCRFLVAGRVGPNGRFRAATDLLVPPDLADLFQPLPSFRIDISSTELRQTGRRGSR